MPLPKVTETVMYVGPKPYLVFETKSGERYTPEQWQIMVDAARVEKKLDQMDKKLDRLATILHQRLKPPK